MTATGNRLNDQRHHQIISAQCNFSGLTGNPFVFMNFLCSYIIISLSLKIILEMVYICFSTCVNSPRLNNIIEIIFSYIMYFSSEHEFDFDFFFQIKICSILSEVRSFTIQVPFVLRTIHVQNFSWISSFSASIHCSTIGKLTTQFVTSSLCYFRFECRILCLNLYKDE